MSRTIEPIPSESPPPPRHNLASLQGKFVCPFCGAVKDGREKPCPRCTLEDTPQTRQATRARIGPWYVLQARNPSAPGMKYETLLVLVRRGQVTPRSIVRGPTTHQFWRFAAKVKGLSREFGLCYHCEAEIETTANLCPHCQKIQEPPLNPDVLLESKPGVGPIETVRREIPAAAPAAVGANKPTASGGAPAAQPEASAAPPAGEGAVSPVLQTDAPAPWLAGPAVDAGEERAIMLLSAPVPAATARARQKAEPILSARELAAAFQLDFQPPAERVADITEPHRVGRWLLKAAAVLLAAGVLTVVAILVFVPSLRRDLRDWATATFAASPPVPAPPSKGPVVSTGSPFVPPARAEEPRKAEEPKQPVEPRAQPAPATRAAPKVDPVAAVQLPAPKPPTTTQAVAPPVKVDPPPVKIDPPPVKIDPPPARVVVLPATQPKPAPAATTKPAAAVIEDPVETARQLRSKAITAESLNRFEEAIRLYEQIQLLPREAWPRDLGIRLELAKRQLSAEKDRR